MKPYPEAYLDYLIFFHAERDYFECHEVMEEYWKQHPTDERSKTYVGLIQIAVGIYHERRGNTAGAVKMLQSAIRNLNAEHTASLGLSASELEHVVMERIALIQEGDRNRSFTDINLPIADPELVQYCEAKCQEQGLTWQSASDLQNPALIHKHTVRDRTPVIREREAQILLRRQKRRPNMSSEGKILVVDDEPHIAEVVRLYLEHSNFEAILLTRGAEVHRTIRAEKPVLVILDIMLPDISGYELCEGIRRMEAPLDQIPIIFLTAKGESIDKLRGFNLGVDDYLVKPFDPNELIARIKAVLRRSMASSADPNKMGSDSSGRVLQIGNIVVDLEQFRVLVDNKRIDLTPKEMELLYFLASHPGRVFTREDLLGYIWNFDFAGGTRTVDAHVKNLRKKLGQHKEWNIQTLWGIGYSFEVKPHA
ncbi:DUF309 domain-containing protein [Paenibacillus hexagrammi]|uniref:DUF309 domain-containing protein n=1 Tax=Paenibacillus hexagrammi TaxID=2908839 RepID=A0ABY3SRZ9_9BACL|nr:DUF309 domain-containing protein [Paenibacillus sp. YPD9-1]UJF36039.1 DUF309 domain-containing protein [Paenibacillus sp. YPD9-1]